MIRGHNDWRNRGYKPRALVAVLIATALWGSVTLSCSSDRPESLSAPEATSSSTSIPYDTELSPAPCDDPGIPNDRIECLTLTVPENRSEPMGRQVELPVLRIHPRSMDQASATNASEAPASPIVFLHGGPGGSGISEWIGWMELADDLQRELVLYDQRGGGSAIPSLRCPERDEALADLLSREPGWDEAKAAVQGALAACHERLTDKGVDLAMYRTDVSVADLEDLRSQLGVEKMTLVGTSYGAKLALRYTSAHDAKVDSLVLASPDLPWAEDEAALVNGAIRRLVSACRDEPTCNSEHPDLGAAVDRAIQRFSENPEVVAGTTLDAPSVIVTGGRFVAGLFAAMYETNSIRLLPTMIHGLADGADIPATTVGARLNAALTAGVAFGALMSVNCTETPPSSGSGRRSDAGPVPEPNARSVQLFGWQSYCKAWRTVPDDEPTSNPERDRDRDLIRILSSDRIPVLVIAGALDPTTPADRSQDFAERANADYVEVPWGGHDVLSATTCAQAAFKAFLKNPGIPPPGC